MTELAGKKVLITGAASGIGRLLAQKIAARGADLMLWDVDADGLQELAGDVEGLRGRATVHRVDVSDRHAVRATARDVLNNHGAVDVLINNAGVVAGKPLLELSDEEIERTLDINAMAHFWTVRAFLPAMIERDSGHIVTVASAGGLVAAPRLSDYSASKFAAVGFDEALRLELRQQGLRIKTTLVCPFYVKTGMFEGVKTRFPWLLPLAEPAYVADRIVAAIEKDHRRLITPWFAYVAFPLRLLPVRWFDALVDFFGISRGMDDFQGRHG
ncbi:MAG: SDR family oxidoreductase [Gemmatimonadetes bacterium]|uniref:SDR family oxidoreductase n=1 Tax=Candidatus Kutchimonas denitrificans TaxID=3056748 RepID=A0AAE5CDK9_9BACT|nr:SDR family oxidoreductase [Gemmatimonadota bacterium]NIR75989.1 SDR family oxidoreductase [Candidatus Kutchimonas denitrificans]NIS02181.1 SDR family oxidoreductase [Gemmatimonadota bacterium]NIT68007.1 SDR family oxidoreductase [Gemmatimonadota bacterium]NIU54033.1 SDR family NAD(P)-dependent oxidoreductase [Gemmatimonadota bacterium]